jgi:uroporphyrinogen-III synthase
VVVTRATEQAEALCRELAARGAVPLQLPTVGFAPAADTGPLDRALASLAEFDWLLLTSQNTVRALAERFHALQLDPHASGGPNVAAVGPATAEAATRAGFQVTYAAREHRGAALAGELGTQLRGAHVLLPRSDRASADLPEALRALGARVTEVVAYHTVRPQPNDDAVLRAVQGGEADVITFFSPSAFRNFAEELGLNLLRTIHSQTAIAVIGPVTASALRDAGIIPDVISPDASVDSLVAALRDFFLLRQPGARAR